MEPASAPRVLSPAGLDLIKAYETLRLSIYQDEAGYWTIGWGHRVRRRELFPPVITEVWAGQLLSGDTGWACDCVNAWAARLMRLAQHEFDALVCFTFNVGAIAFQNSRLRRKLLDGDRAGAADEFLAWDKMHLAETGRLIESPGLAKRRAAERALFLGLPWQPP